MGKIVLKIASKNSKFRKLLIKKLAQGYLPEGWREAKKLKYKPGTKPGDIWLVSDNSGPEEITKYRSINPKGKAKTFRDYMDAKKWAGKA